MNSVLVVCIGNICRSPMAEGLLAQALPRLHVSSAGTGALVGHPADPMAVALMRERGIDITAHRARQLDRRLCLNNDILLVMDSTMRREVMDRYPEASGRVFRICDTLQGGVPDPYRQSEAAFRDALSLMEEGVQQWLQRIRKLEMFAK